MLYIIFDCRVSESDFLKFFHARDYVVRKFYCSYYLRAAAVAVIYFISCRASESDFFFTRLVLVMCGGY